MGFREDLCAYSERSSALIEESPQMDEQNTKRKIIEPLIETLGWDILSTALLNSGVFVDSRNLTHLVNR
jgi:hypothetical protein